MKTQAQKATEFQQLHTTGTFIMPNPWDVGSARFLETTGFLALASTSAGMAFSQGLPVTAVGRDGVMRHLAQLAAATDVPINADLENCFGDVPEIVAEAFRMALWAGAVGGSEEDTTNNPENPIYDIGLATERVHAAVESVRNLPIHFTVTARAANFLYRRQDLRDTIRRLQAFQDAGADVLYAPGVKS